jgi:transcription elongation factor Elf1
MSKLTNKQEEEYLKSPSKCPYCKSEDIEAGAVDIDSGHAMQKVQCLNCEKQWRDHYELVAIEPD